VPKEPPKKASGAGRNRNKTKDGRRNVIGERLRELRRSSTPKVTQEDLAGRVAAQHVSLDRTAIYRIEMGTRAVTDLELVALAKALRIKMADLF
jgi:DNA-binding XRE family transcriptional regulator